MLLLMLKEMMVLIQTSTPEESGGFQQVHAPGALRSRRSRDSYISERTGCMWKGGIVGPSDMLSGI